MEILLTVITVSYNAEKTIEKTVKSVIRNKSEYIEYIIIDGLSTDRTMTIVEKYKNKIDKVVSEKDFGLYDALNKGIKMSRGKYIMLLAADDSLIDNSLEIALKTIKPGIDVWCGTIVQKNSYGYFYEKSDPDLEQLKYHCSLRNPASIFKRSTFEKFGYYDTKYKCDGDRELFLRFYLSGAKFQIENIPIVIFNVGGISTADRTKLAIPEGIEISRRYGLSEEIVNRYYNKMMKQEIWKGKLLRNGLTRTLFGLLYSYMLYPWFCGVRNRENNKLSKAECKNLEIL